MTTFSDIPRRTRACFAALFALALGAGCGGERLVDPGPGEPAKIVPSTDASRARSAMIGPAGGVISVTAASGATYRFAVPASAVLTPTMITVTPIEAVAGLPLSRGFLGGVEFAPDGLQLALPATLTITPAQPFDRRELVAFGYHAGAQAFHLRQSADSANTITLSVTHFSGDGAALGTAAEVASQLSAAPAAALSPDDRLAQRMAQLIDAARRAGQGLPDQQAVADAYRQYYRDGLRPRLVLAAASAPYDSTRAAVVRSTSWLRELTLFGLDDQFVAERTEITTLFTTAVNRLFADATRACTDQHRFEQIPMMVELARVGELMLAIHLPALDEMRRCMSFTLDLTIATDVTGVAVHHTMVAAAVPLRMSSDASAPLAGTAAPSTAAWQMTQTVNLPPGCSIASTAPNAPSPVRVSSMRLVTPTTTAPPTDVSLVLDSQLGWMGNALMTCPTSSLPLVVAIPWLASSSAATSPTGWEMPGGATYARLVRDVSITTTDGTITSHLTMILRHTPGI